MELTCVCQAFLYKIVTGHEKGLVWFLLFSGISTFMGFIMQKLSL